MNPIEFELNNAKLKVFSSGDIWKWVEFKHTKKWVQAKGCINIQKSGYKEHRTMINNKTYNTARIIYQAFNLEWKIEDNGPHNTIDHIDRNSLNHKIENLRVANKLEQALNRDYILNAKGCYLQKNGRWKAQIQRNRKIIQLGYFDTEDEARQAYLLAVANR
jgi:hypothetical protein